MHISKKLTAVASSHEIEKILNPDPEIEKILYPETDVNEMPANIYADDETEIKANGPELNSTIEEGEKVGNIKKFEHEQLLENSMCSGKRKRMEQ